MANVGDTFPVGAICSETGQYGHTACTNTEIFNKGNKFAPCANSQCKEKGANWKLLKKLT